MRGAGWEHPRGPRVLTVCPCPTAYRTVCGVNGPLVVLDNVKVRAPSSVPRGWKGDSIIPPWHGCPQQRCHLSWGHTAPARLWPPAHVLAVPVVGESLLCQGVTPSAVSLGAGGDHRAVPTLAWLPAPSWGREWAMGQCDPRPLGCPLSPGLSPALGVREPSLSSLLWTQPAAEPGEQPWLGV